MGNETLDVFNNHDVHCTLTSFPGNFRDATTSRLKTLEEASNLSFSDTLSLLTEPRQGFTVPSQEK